MSDNRLQAHGRRIVKHTSWVTVYQEFQIIASHVLETASDYDEARGLICDEIDSLYAQHEGDPAWDTAYTKWIEPADDDLYVDESSPILK